MKSRQSTEEFLFFSIWGLIKAELKDVMHPGGYHPEWCELFTHIFELMYLWALCCLVDKRRTHLASSSWLAYVKYGSFFFFSLLLRSRSFQQAQEMSWGQSCGVLSNISGIQRHAQIVHYNGFLFVWLVYILQTKSNLLFPVDPLDIFSQPHSP